MLKQLFTAALSLLIVSSTWAQTDKVALQNYNDGLKQIEQKKYAEAMGLFKKAIDISPDYKEALYSAGWTSNELKKYSDAADYLQKAKKLWPEEAKVYLELGYACDKLDKKGDALDNYNKCLSLKDDYSLAYKYLGVLYYDEEDYENALKNIKSYLNYEPDSKDDDVYFRKAVSENELDNYEDALVSIKKADALKPNYPKFINEMGFTYHKLKDNEEALRLYKKSLALDPENVRANYWIG